MGVGEEKSRELTSERDRCQSGTRRCRVYGWPWDRSVSGPAKRINRAELIAGLQRATNGAGRGVYLHKGSVVAAGFNLS